MNPVYSQIDALVPNSSPDLELDCGTGELLAYLQKQRRCTGYGVELDDANRLACE